MKTWKINDKVLIHADEGCKLKLSDGSLVVLYKASADEDISLIEEVYVVGNTIIDEETFTRRSLLHELKEIQDWFLSTDYIPNKVVVGEWDKDDERFVSYCQERATKRIRQDEIKTILGIPC